MKKVLLLLYICVVLVIPVGCAVSPPTEMEVLEAKQHEAERQMYWPAYYKACLDARGFIVRENPDVLCQSLDNDCLPSKFDWDFFRTYDKHTGKEMLHFKTHHVYCAFP